MSQPLTARAAAARTLGRVCQGESLARALPAGLEASPLEHRPLIQELVYGTLREWQRLEGIAQQLLRKPLRGKDADIFSLILLGIHQLSGLQTPHHVAVGETVEAGRSLGKPWSAGLINGCLRNYQRDVARLESRLTAAQQQALPEWLWGVLIEQWPEQALDIARASRTHPPLTLRINSSRVDPMAYQATLAEAGIAARISDHTPTALTLEKPRSVAKIPGFLEGLSSVQDASAQLSMALLQPREGESILDACAAPGGKTCHILECAPGTRVLAADISEQRLASLRENTQRLGLAPDIEVLDATRAGALLAGRKFDAVLADVPCSATGVIRRNPDIKVTRVMADIHQFAAQQVKILSSLWSLVKPGGRLLYVTCSILDEENDRVIEAASAALPRCRIAQIEAPTGIAMRFGLQALPSETGGDGLYFALLVKDAERE